MKIIFKTSFDIEKVIDISAIPLGEKSKVAEELKDEFDHRFVEKIQIYLHDDVTFGQYESIHELLLKGSDQIYTLEFTLREL